VLDDNGNYVEVAPDSLETDAARRERPQFKSAGGRVVYGGGAITPDVIVPYDTLTTAEQKLARALVPSSQDVYLVLDDYAFSGQGAASSPTSPSPPPCAMRCSSASRPRA
jgi:hypothetical protein